MLVKVLCLGGSGINRSLCRIKDKGYLFCVERGVLLLKSEVGGRKSEVSFVTGI